MVFVHLVRHLIDRSFSSLVRFVASCHCRAYLCRLPNHKYVDLVRSCAHQTKSRFGDGCFRSVFTVLCIHESSTPGRQPGLFAKSFLWSAESREKCIFLLSPFASQNLVSRDRFGRRVSPLILHTQAGAGAYSRVPLIYPAFRNGVIYTVLPPAAIGSVPGLSGHASPYRRRSQ